MTCGAAATTVPNLDLARAVGALHRDELANLSPADRELALDLHIYAALWRREATEAHVAVLPLRHDLALQRHWRAHRAAYLAAAEAAVERRAA